MRLVDVLVPIVDHYSSSHSIVDTVIRRMFQVTNEKDVDIIVDLAKTLYKKNERWAYQIRQLLPQAAQDAHPRLFEAFLSLSWSNARSGPIVKAMFETSPARWKQLQHIIQKVVPKNAQLAQELAVFFEGNRTKPCGDIKVFVIDWRMTPRTVRYLINGKSVGVTIQREAPVEIIQQLKAGPIRACRFTPSILSMYDNLFAKAYSSNYIIVLAVHPGTSAVLAAAACERESDLLSLEYLCSAHVCKGAGATVMRVIEKYAQSADFRRVQLISVPSANAFYKKMGYNTNSNSNQRRAGLRRRNGLTLRSKRVSQNNNTPKNAKRASQNNNKSKNTKPIKRQKIAF
jgi:Acetyltransferase (GNAT) domain